MTPEELSKPLTPIEHGELTNACSKVLTPAGMCLLRRLGFERDRLRNAVAERTEKCAKIAEQVAINNLAIRISVMGIVAKIRALGNTAIDKGGVGEGSQP